MNKEKGVKSNGRWGMAGIDYMYVGCSWLVEFL
jgi:hypothetical protein